MENNSVSDPGLLYNLPFINEHIILFPNAKLKTLPNSKSLQTTISNLMKIVESCPNRKQQEKEILLVTSDFSFSHIVFKRLVMQTCKNQGLLGKGLMSTLTFSQMKHFRVFQPDTFADGNFKFDKYGGNFSERVEKAMEKTEIGQYHQFLVSPLGFRKTCTVDT